MGSKAMGLNMHSSFGFGQFNGVTLLIVTVVVWNLHAVDAVFAPADRSALQTALFGCVGACNDVQGSGTDTSYCNNNGPWTSGTGAGCDAGSTHGAIDAWDVSRVASMHYSEWQHLTAVSTSTAAAVFVCL